MSRNLTAILAMAIFAWCPAALAQQGEQPRSSGPIPPVPWPDVAPGRILSTPDWSDYKIYPLAARRKNAEGAVAAEMLVGADGKPLECRVVQSSGSTDLDDGTCNLMVTMRFEPARDAADKAIQSRFRRRISWLLDDPRAFVSSAIEADVRIGSDGRKRCKVSYAEGGYAAFWTVTACSFFGDTDYFLNGNATVTKRFVIAARLDAGDGSAFLSRPWPQGKPIAQETVAFEVNKNGDPANCTARDSRGFGPRGINNLSPCGRLLSSLWLKDAFEKHGTMETRVYMLDDGQ